VLGRNLAHLVPGSADRGEVKQRRIVTAESVESDDRDFAWDIDTFVPQSNARQLGRSVVPGDDGGRTAFATPNQRNVGGIEWLLESLFVPDSDAHTQALGRSKKSLHPIKSRLGEISNLLVEDVAVSFFREVLGLENAAQRVVDADGVEPGDLVGNGNGGGAKFAQERNDRVVVRGVNQEPVERRAGDEFKELAGVVAGRVKYDVRAKGPRCGTHPSKQFGEEKVSCIKLGASGVDSDSVITARLKGSRYGIWAVPDSGGCFHNGLPASGGNAGARLGSVQHNGSGGLANPDRPRHVLKRWRAPIVPGFL